VQQPAVRLVVFLRSGTLAVDPVTPFRQGLKEAGFVGQGPVTCL